MGSATKATLPSKTTATPPPPPPPTTTTTTTTQVTTKKCHHANFPFGPKCRNKWLGKIFTSSGELFPTKWKVGGRDLTHEPRGGFPVGRLTGRCGKGWNECEARSIFLVEEESMRKILIWKRSITWKEIKKKEKWFKDTDSFKRFHSMFPKKVWLLSKRPLTWRFQIDFFSIYSRKLCIINPSLTTGYGQPLRAFRQQAGFCTDGFHLELRCSFCKVLSLQEPWQ